MNPSRTESVLPEDRPRNDKIVGLQHLRAVAAVIVVLDHALMRSIRGGPQYPWLAFVATEIGAVGVWTFFVISGFIMLHISWNQFAEPGAPFRFIRHRIIRVVPLYWLLTLVFFVTAPIPSSIIQLIKSLLFIPYLNFNKEAHPVLEQGWTLNYEILFYVVFVFALLFRRPTGIIVAVMGLVALLVFGQVSGDLGTPGLVWTSLPLTLFVFGIALAFARRRFGQFGQWPSASFWASILLLAAAAGMSLLTNNIDVLASGHILHWETVVLWMVCTLAVGMVTLFQHSGANMLGRTFEYLGDASYSIYLAHGFALAIMGKIWERFLPSLPPPLFVVVGFFASVAAGIFVYIAIERPLTHFLSRKAGR